MPDTPIRGSRPAAEADAGAHLEDTAGGRPRWVRRELIIYGVALLVGLVLVPLLIWVGGNRVLGPYTHGASGHAGPWALLEDFFVGLLHGSAVFWAVALGPALFLLLLRLFVRLLRSLPPDASD